MSPAKVWTIPNIMFGVYDPDQMILLQVGLDGSYGVRQPIVFAYAGVAGYEDAWKVAAPEWRAILARYGISRFRMAEATHFEGDFRKKATEWGDGRELKLNELLNLLADVVIQARLQAVGWAVDMVLLSDKHRAAQKRDVLERVIRQLLRVVPDAAQLALVCDREEDLATEVVMSWFNHLKLSEPTVYARIAGVCYMNSRDVVLIQAADMLAYLFRADLERVHHAPSTPTDPLLDKLTRAQVVYRSF